MKQRIVSRLSARGSFFVFVLLGLFAHPLPAFSAPDLMVTAVDAIGLIFGPGEREVNGTVAATIRNAGTTDTEAGLGSSSLKM